MAEFKEEDKIKRLLWCDRHCCLCKKICGIDIEFAHLPSKEDSEDINDGIPVCSACHIKINAYNPEHPKGTKYKLEELTKRREQVYEEYTRQLVPAVHFEITQGLRTFPDVGFNIINLGNSLPVKALVTAKIFLGGNFLREPGGHYSSKEFWNLNPQMGYSGHFKILEAVEKKERLEIEISVSIVDIYDRYHELLPVSWVYEREGNYWFANP